MTKQETQLMTEALNVAMTFFYQDQNKTAYADFQNLSADVLDKQVDDLAQTIYFLLKGRKQ